jgi:hypothetical protein
VGVIIAGRTARPAASVRESGRDQEHPVDIDDIAELWYDNREAMERAPAPRRGLPGARDMEDE